MTTQQTWYVSEAGRFVYAHDETIPVARMLPGPNMGARGKLIAAAPDMLAALRECVTEPGAVSYRNAKYMRMRLEYITQVAREAIARIDGAS